MAQKWIHSRQGVSMEMVDVSNPRSNTDQHQAIIQGSHNGQKNWANIVKSNENLEQATERALRQ
jgi:hypothetical protein